MQQLRADEHRAALGFLTVGEVDALCDAGIRVLDPCSALISARVTIGPGTVIYPSVVIQASAGSTIALGNGNLLFPGTVVIADRGGQVRIGDRCELGPGGVQIKANVAGAAIRLGATKCCARGEPGPSRPH